MRMDPVRALASIREELDRRGHNRVRIVVVTKTHGPELIETLLKAGHREFGENRFTEARAKFALVHAQAIQPIYHHLGPLQSGFARNLPGLFQVVQGVSSVSALESLLKAARKHFEATGEGMQYLMQLNLTAESSKLGGMSEEQFLQCRESLPSEEALTWRGFMTMGPTDQDAKRTSEVFRRLRQIRDEHLPDGELSMGMSGDWQLAVEEGATIVRIGTAITGTRAGGPWTPESG
ncbi:MAG: YggS family pyridoxal phosphate-dependent enzyme [Spirochaetae bacterium HGW-Spirochaetae-10]|nr:MAG: YggS family pyridoxal phosphate-dependent enzyme [Spirochaetae bacterium HGW-Spirochaetae-10]